LDHNTELLVSSPRNASLKWKAHSALAPRRYRLTLSRMVLFLNRTIERSSKSDTAYFEMIKFFAVIMWNKKTLTNESDGLNFVVMPRKRPFSLLSVLAD